MKTNDASLQPGWAPPLLLFWFSGLHTWAHRMHKDHKRPTLLLPFLLFRSMTPIYHSSLLEKVCNYINPLATITLLCGSSELPDIIVSKLEMTTSQPGQRQLTSSDLGQCRNPSRHHSLLTRESCPMEAQPMGNQRDWVLYSELQSHANKSLYCWVPKSSWSNYQCLLAKPCSGAELAKGERERGHILSL